ncbi:hypothetical protein [Dyadobacter pollutisoli]|uniref:DUF3324 domain-containing protein n=1 Tax=Dyadobacter pollutisoli TaxID=2910158 RepID=A0A9E8SPG4_9BACT|nr:hypothetical protein [Dyadobacter pollutisoli]WAC14701.1 hypothetical protein ON006_12210 [Dyadobacter pollutisoli]
MKLAAVLALILLTPCYIQASVVILNGLSHTHTLSSVDTPVQGVIRVKNEGPKESRIVVYRQDLVPECGKGFSYPQAGSHARSLGNALKTNVDEKLLASNEEYDLRYVIGMDKDKTSPGTYWEVVMVEVGEPIRERQKNGIEVSSSVRYAIQVIVDVASFESPELTYENVTFNKVPDQQGSLNITLKNKGVFGIRASVVLEVYDASGNKVKTTEPINRMLYPGHCSTFEIALNNLPRGKYDCVIVADTKQDLFGSNISLQIE